MSTTVTETEYKGNPLLVIRQTPDEPFPFQFGLKKARLMLQHVDAIRSFVAKYQKASA